MNKFSRTGVRVAALVVAATMLTTGVVLADEVQGDGDGAVPVASSTLFFDGNTAMTGQQSVCVGQTYVDTFLVAIQRDFAVVDDGNNDIRTYDNNATVTISLRSPADNSTEISEVVNDSTILLPSNWTSLARLTMSTDPSIATGNPSAEITVTLTPTSTGLKNADVNVSGVGKRQRDANNLTKNQILKVNWTAINCNTAPSMPGAPAPTPASPNQGGFTLNWTASTDDGNPNPPAAVTYSLEGKRVGESFGSIASSIATNSYGFTSSNPAEGTWTYRVRASDSALTSAYSLDSDPVVVDRTAPTFGTCPTGGPYLLNSGGGSQSVGPISASDGTLPDGSAGSGVNAGASTLSGTVSTTSVGSKAVTFTAVDNAGNSRQTVCNYSVIYGFSGFFSPVDNNGVLNKAKAGQAIPFKWRLTDANGDPVLNLTSATLTAVSLSCSVATSADLVEELATGQSGLQNLGDGYYQFNWATPKSYGNSCKTAKLNLGEGVGYEHTALFQFTK